MRADDHLDLVIQFDDWLGDLGGDLAQAVGGDEHHDGGEDHEGKDEVHADVVAYLLLHFVDLGLDDRLGEEEGEFEFGYAVGGALLDGEEVDGEVVEDKDELDGLAGFVVDDRDFADTDCLCWHKHDVV